MYSSAPIEQLTKEIILHIASYLDVSDILQLNLTSKVFKDIMKDELLFKILVKRDYSSSSKESTMNYVDFYKKLMTSHYGDAMETDHIAMDTLDDNSMEILGDKSVESQSDSLMDTVETADAISVTDDVSLKGVDKSTIDHKEDCPHLIEMNDTTLEIKRILYQSDNGHLCDICRSESAVYLNMSPDCHNEACQSCLEKHLDDGPVQLNFNTGELVCFQCMKEGHAYKFDENNTSNTIALSVLNYIKSADIEDELNCRRKAEHTLYVQELRREDMSIKHYLIEKQWGRSWMLFRTREGSPLPGRISNHKLARSNGTLDPNIRLPMDKYRPSPETHGDIISERLWNYLSHAYGVQGSAYSEDDIIAPEYARLRVYVDDFKKSIHLYP